MALHRVQRTTIANLPADLLSNIADHLSQDDVAALRSTCQALRRAVDLAVTDVTFHANVDAAELRSTTNRCTGTRNCCGLCASRVESQHAPAAAECAPHVQGCG